MNKTVTINLAGIIFHIDEDAYQKLSNYLFELKKSFANQEGSDEIIDDIEARFAELFREKSREVIVMAVVDEVIAIMGQPEDYVDIDYAEETKNTEDDTYSQKQEYTGTAKKRRIFRNPDDTMLGGVCSGVAAYFDTDPLWIRLGFVISVFGFGTGFLLYVILWVIIPEAKTTAEKLQMRGEPINVENISKSIKEEMEFLKKNFQGDSNFQETATKASKRTGGFIANIILLLGKISIKIIAVLAILISITIIFAILSAMFGGSAFFNFPSHFSGDFNVSSMQEFFNVPLSSIWILIIGVTLLIGIPVIQILMISIRALFNLKAQHKAISISLSVLWVISIGCVIVGGISSLGKFKHNSVNREMVNLDGFESDTLNLKLEKDDMYFILQDNVFDCYFDMDENRGYNNNVSLDIVKTNDEVFKLEIIKRARGQHQREAKNHAKKIKYHYTSYSDEIVFYDYFSCPQQQSFLAQEVDIILHVPVGKTIILDETLRYFMYDIKNQHDMYDSRMLNHLWLMERQGLKCIDCFDNSFEE